MIPTTATPTSSTSADPRDAPLPEGEAPDGDLDLEEDVAPNLGGEDQMQDA
jgi:hypothetical protein